jgi:hypothetical protein
MSRNCTEKSSCQWRECNWSSKHSELLHNKARNLNKKNEDKSQNEDKSKNEEHDDEIGAVNFTTGTESKVHVTGKGKRAKGLFFAVVPVTLRNPANGKSVTAYAMADNCSNTDVLSQHAVDALGLSVRRSEKTVKITTVTGKTDVPMANTSVVVSSFQLL